MTPIKNEIQYKDALTKLENIFDALPGTPEGDMAYMLVLLIEDYEKKHFPIDAPDPIDAIKYMMEEKDLSKKDIVKYVGSISLVTQVLNRQKNLSLRMIKALHNGLGLPYDALIA